MKITDIKNPNFLQTVSKEDLLKLLTDAENKIIDLREKVEHLQNQFALLRRQLYGRKSEKNTDEMPVLPGFEDIFDDAYESPEENLQAPQEEQKSTSVKEKKGAKVGRRPLPKTLPREQVIHDLPASEKVCGCGQSLCKIGEEKSEQLEIIPATVKVIEHVRYKYSCRTCGEGVRTAPLPAQPIPKSMATAGLLSHVFVSKFDDHLPLYRQTEIWERLGVDLPRSTLSNWVMKGGDLLAPVVELLKQEIVKSDYVRADETPVQVLNHPDRKATDKSYMWVYMTGYSEQPSLVYEYQSAPLLRKGRFWPTVGFGPLTLETLQ